MFAMNPMRQATTLMTISTEVGANIPKPAVAAYDRAHRITTQAGVLGRSGTGLSHAVTDALDAGRDPAADPEVSRIYLASQIGNLGVTQAVENEVAKQMCQVFHEHADAIIRALGKPFAQAAKVMATAHERIGDLALEDTGSILRKGGDIGEVWGKAKDANARAGRLAEAWVILSHLTGFAPVDPRYPALRIASATTAKQWIDAGLERAKPSAWDVHRAGLGLGLADSGEYERRVGVVSYVPAPAA